MDRDDARECAFIRLYGATERLMLLFHFRNERNYEVGMRAVEAAIAEYRAKI